MRSAPLLLLVLLLAADPARAECVVDPGGNPVVALETRAGTICIELFPEAPGFSETVPNFLGYVSRGDYDGTFIHRSVPGFVIQGGGFRYQGGDYSWLCEGDVCPTITNEFQGVSEQQSCGPAHAQGCNVRGTVAMAKTGAPDSATSQWFINLADANRFLDSAANGGFTIFGRVVSGMEVAEAIAGMPVIDAEFLLPTPLRPVFSELPLASALPASCFDLSEVSVVLAAGQAFCTSGVPLEPDPLLGDLYFVSPPCFSTPAVCPGQQPASLNVCRILRRSDGALVFDGLNSSPSSCEQREASDTAQGALAAEVPERLVEISRAFVVPEPSGPLAALAALATLGLLPRPRRRRKEGRKDP